MELAYKILAFAAKAAALGFALVAFFSLPAMIVGMLPALGCSAAAYLVYSVGVHLEDSASRGRSEQ